MDLLTQTKRPKLSDYELEIPEKLIAQYPHPERDQCRLMTVDRNSGKINEGQFGDILNFLSSGDVLVLNNTQVYPARIVASRDGGETKFEMLLLRELDQDLWEVLVRPARKVRVGNRLQLSEGVTCEVVDSTSSGSRIMQFDSPNMPFQNYLDKVGKSPLPPYIAREAEPTDKLNYQTVFASKRGAVAAPTAGLHFTQKLLTKLEDAGINLVFITLHIGIGTFRPIRVEDVTRHQMDCEYFAISPESAKTINDARAAGQKVFAVGTSATRALETESLDSGQVIPGTGWTDKFIYPPYKFKVVDGLITNFHQPKSTLIMLVSAFAGSDLIMNSYRRAIKDKYRFFSYGDAMLIH